MSAPTVSRREFLTTSSLLALTAAVPASAAVILKSKTAAPGEPVAASTPATAGLATQALGRTGLPVSVISLGTGPGQAPNVIRYAVSKGINFIHTSTGYAGGKAIKNVGTAIKGMRDKVILALKITWAPDDDRAMDAALKTLGVDSVELALFNIHNGREVKEKKYQKGAERWIKAGKFKHIGLTSHGDVAECCKAALQQKFYEVLMPAYTISQEKEFVEVFAQAKEQQVGVMLMKSRGQLGAEAYLKSVPLYLAEPAITTICKGMTSLADIDGTIAAVAVKPTAALRSEVARLAGIAMAGHCTMCGACTQACPRGVAVNDLVRCSDYYMARPDDLVSVHDTLAGLAAGQLPQACTQCSACERACPRGVPIVAHLRRTATLVA
jgi:predicted aldo/keto reductase-like oxidoreductase